MLLSDVIAGIVGDSEYKIRYRFAQVTKYRWRTHLVRFSTLTLSANLENRVQLVVTRRGERIVLLIHAIATCSCNQLAIFANKDLVKNRLEVSVAIYKKFARLKSITWKFRTSLKWRDALESFLRERWEYVIDRDKERDARNLVNWYIAHSGLRCFYI